MKVTMNANSMTTTMLNEAGKNKANERNRKILLKKIVKRSKGRMKRKLRRCEDVSKENAILERLIRKVILCLEQEQQ